ncbi:MAG: MATE family efflux transporter [Phycisphaerae bacterium]
MKATTDYPEWQESDAASMAPQELEPLLTVKSGGRLDFVDQKPTAALVLKLASPAIMEQVLNAVIGLTDTVIAGHLPGSANTISAAAAAVGIMTYLQWFAGLMTAALAVGATAIVARAFGARRARMARRVAGTSLSAAFIISTLLSVVLYVFARPIAYGCGLSGLSALFAQQYLQIMVITISLQTTAQIGMACIRGAGDTVRPMAIMFMVMLVNLVASGGFTFGWFGLPAWGIRGDAFGTLLAYLAGGLSAALVLFSGLSPIKLRLRHLKIVPHILMRVLKIGIPSWLEGVLLWGGQFLIVIFVINSRNDPNGYLMAAHSAVLRIESISFLPGFGFGIAASTLVGQYLGAGKPDAARQAGRIANMLGLGTMTALALPMVFFPRFMLSLIVDSPPVVNVGLWPLVLAGLSQPAFALAIVLSGALKGAGETVLPMICTVSGILVVRWAVLAIALYWLFQHGIHNENLVAVWVAIWIDLNYRGIFNAIVFARGRWQKKQV